MVKLFIFHDNIKCTICVELLVSQILGDLLYKSTWRDFKLAVMSTVWKETHAYGLNGLHLTWQYLCDSPNRQIKATAKYTTYTVLQLANG